MKEAQKRAFDKIRPGSICREVDAAARDYIYQQGYEGCFSHGLGHSVGVEVHENPRFNEICTDRLIPGIVITVEPGDEVWIGEKFQSNPEIAGSPRNSFRASLDGVLRR